MCGRASRGNCRLLIEHCRLHLSSPGRLEKVDHNAQKNGRRDRSDPADPRQPRLHHGATMRAGSFRPEEPLWLESTLRAFPYSKTLGATMDRKHSHPRSLEGFVFLAAQERRGDLQLQNLIGPFVNSAHADVLQMPAGAI